MLRLFLSTALILWLLPVLGQDLVSYSSKDGLPEGEVLGLQIDGGKIWYVVKTIDPFDSEPYSSFSVGYYDGYRFTNFPVLDGQKYRLHTGLAAFELFGAERFILVLENPDLILSFDRRSMEANYLMLDQERLVYDAFSCHTDALYVIKQINDSISELYSFQTELEKLRSLPAGSQTGNFLGVSNDKILFSGSDCSMHTLDVNGGQASQLALKYLFPASLQSNELSCDGITPVLSRQDTHFLFLDKPLNALLQVHPGSGTASLVERIDPKYVFESFFIDQHGHRLSHLFDPKINHRLIRLTYREADTRVLNEELNPMHEISTLASTDLRRSLWFGNSTGLHHLDLEQSVVERKMPGVNLRAITPLDDSILMIGGDKVGWMVYNKRTGAYRVLQDDNQRYNSVLPSFSFIREDSDLFWSNSKQKIHLVRLPNTVLETHPIDALEYISASSALAEDFYIASPNKIHRFNTSTRTQEILLDTTAIGTIYYILPHPDHLILCSNTGLFSFRPDDLHLTAIQTGHTFYSALAADGRLYAGTASGKLFVFEADQNYEHIKNITVGSGIYSMIRENADRLWLGCQKGIALVQDDGVQHTTYGYSWNFELNRYSTYYDTAEQKLYFGGLAGLDVVDLNRVRDLGTFDIYPSFVSYYERDSLINIQAMSDHGLNYTIPAENRFFQMDLHHSLTEFGENIQFYYRFLPENDWIHLGKSNSMILSNLEPGTQKIEVRAINAFQQEAENRLFVNLQVGRFFYETLWFKIGVAGLLFGMLLFWYRRIKSENRRLEAEVKARTAELRSDKETIEKQALELRQLDQMKNQFFSNISHELKTPLSLILSPVRKLLKNNTLSEEEHYYLTLVHAHSKLLEERVAELLELSRLEGKQITLERQNTQLKPFIQSAVDAFIPLAEEKEITIHCTNRVPGHLAVIIDRRRLLKIIQNLFQNAIKFTKAGGDIRFSAVQKDTLLQMRIEDTGIGIAPEHLEHITKRFYQVPGEKRSANPGTGIGLSMVKEYLDLMGADLTIESEPGKGTSIKIKLPLEPALEAVEEPTVGYNNAEETRAAVSSGLKVGQQPGSEAAGILLVEDHAGLREYLTRVLSPHYRIIQARHGKEALQLLARHPGIHIILSDIMMPEMDGTALLARVRQSRQFRHLPFLFLTARGNVSLKHEMLRIGVDDYLTKPFDEEELLVRLQAVYKNYILRMEARLEDQLGTFQAPEDPEDFIKRLEYVVQSHLNHPQFGTEFIAEQLGMSRSTLNRAMKREIGILPNEYIREVQMTRARQLIEANPSLDLDEILKQLGLKDKHHFLKNYQQRFGKQPQGL